MVQCVLCENYSTTSDCVTDCVCVYDSFKLVIGTQTQQYLINGLHREIERHKLTHRSESCLYTVQYAQCLVMSTPVRHGRTIKSRYT